MKWKIQETLSAAVVTLVSQPLPKDDELSPTVLSEHGWWPATGKEAAGPVVPVR